MNGMIKARGRAESGFSFIEIIVAIAILGGVLVSIASMFILGGRQVKTGKTITQATTFAHAIMETYDTQSFTSLYTGLGATATATSMPTRYSNVTGSPIASWQAEIARKLENGVASVDLAPIGPGTPTFATATALRLTVRISWNELGRPQTVVLSTVRL
jgi:prepilin-type N-terminal cleavage/methylation domain-containing protein